MRFDFHPTLAGWRVSEVNADVPGGWCEAGSLPDLFSKWFPGLCIPESPLKAFSNALCNVIGSGHVALLSAPGFLEDLQVIYTFQRDLSARGIKAFAIQSPGALDWSSGRCQLRSQRLDISAVVRFYQIEWLAQLGRHTCWRYLLLSQNPLVVNPIVAAISESKRLPLAFKTVGKTWDEFVPESRDPRFVDAGQWDSWVLKATYSNTGDRVHFCSEIRESARRSLIRTAQARPFAWVAQRRFETTSLQSGRGPLFPCIGVFVINGKATGAYGRLSKSRIIDGTAIEAPVFIADDAACH
jgi:glutathionylspermidine synthase